jgi:hypothetical protein
VFRLEKSGHVERAEVIQATDLDEAKTEALQLVDGKTLKLWDRTRRMAIYPRRTKRRRSMTPRIATVTAASSSSARSIVGAARIWSAQERFEDLPKADDGKVDGTNFSAESY